MNPCTKHAPTPRCAFSALRLPSYGQLDILASYQEALQTQTKLLRLTAKKCQESLYLGDSRGTGGGRVILKSIPGISQVLWRPTTPPDHSKFTVHFCNICTSEHSGI